MRKCCVCGAHIFESMGCVLARDIIAAITGKIRYDQIRERCCRCSLLKKFPNNPCINARN